MIDYKFTASISDYSDLKGNDKFTYNNLFNIQASNLSS